MQGFQLSGPWKPPAAPATYQALTQIRLRVAASRWADILTSKVIPEGAIFRAVASKEAEDGVLLLRADGEYDDGWFMEKGVIGEFAGKSVVKRVAGIKANKKVAVHTMTQMKGGVPSAPMTERKDSVLRALDDPKLQELCNKSGIDLETLKHDRKFVRTIMRRLYGDEVVA